MGCVCKPARESAKHDVAIEMLSSWYVVWGSRIEASGQWAMVTIMNKGKVIITRIFDAETIQPLPIGLQKGL